MGHGQIGQTGQSAQWRVEEEPKIEPGTVLDLLVEDSVMGQTLRNANAMQDAAHKMVCGRIGLNGQPVLPVEKLTPITEQEAA